MKKFIVMARRTCSASNNARLVVIAQCIRKKYHIAHVDLILGVVNDTWLFFIFFTRRSRAHRTHFTIYNKDNVNNYSSCGETRVCTYEYVIQFFRPCVQHSHFYNCTINDLQLYPFYFNLLVIYSVSIYYLLFTLK